MIGVDWEGIRFHFPNFPENFSLNRTEHRNEMVSRPFIDCVSSVPGVPEVAPFEVQTITAIITHQTTGMTRANYGSDPPIELVAASIMV